MLRKENSRARGLKSFGILLLVVLLALGVWLKQHPRTSVRGHQSAVLPTNSAPIAVAATLISGGTNTSREFDLAVNPYAGALREPGQSKRAWETNFLAVHNAVRTGDAIRFELTEGAMAQGTVKIVQHDEHGLTYFSGELTAPESGRFFFLRPPAGGRAGSAVGVIEFPASKTAYRIEPTGADGNPELWRRRLDEVLCLNLAQPAAAVTNQVEEAPPLRPDLFPNYVPAYNTNLNNTAIISLQSNPGSAAVLLLDFFGGYTPTWGGVNYSAPANIDNNSIKDLWKRIAEDYQAFNINVTTDIKVYLAAPASSRQRCCFTDTPITPAGVAYEGSWNWGSDTPCWSVYTSGKAGAEVGAHEPGHTLGLSHDGQEVPKAGGGTTHNEYYTGRGGGATGWCPIMGAGYYQPVTTFSKGEYLYANNHEDQLNIIATANNGVTYRNDDTGATLAAARYLEIYPAFTASAEGLIDRTGDTDGFRFSTTGGTISLSASPVGDWADLAVSATLADATDTVIASNSPSSVLSASISTNLPAGTYTFRVTGTGRIEPVTNGFSNYSSLGYYSVTGTVSGAVLPNRFTVPENSPNGTFIGIVTSTKLGVDPLTYTIASGNTGNALAINNNGGLSVANKSALDYEALALNTQFTVQFELFVNINDTANPALSETNRRVVVQVIDVNEAPVLVGSTNYLLTGTPAGTVVAGLNATDPDLYTVLNYSIISGNSAGLFSIGAGDGILRVATTPTVAQAGTYNLIVRATDTSASPLSTTVNLRVNVILNNSSLVPGTIAWAVYDGINGTTVGDLTGNANFPANPTFVQLLTQAYSIPNRADNYGSVMRGYVIPPVSGSYNFFIASDDNGSLLLSPDTNAANAVQIASVTGGGGTSSTDPYQWNKFVTQKSTAQFLNAGQAYYLEARQKESAGGDFLQIGWSGPATGGQTNVINGAFLSPATLNYAPQVTGFTANVRRDAFPGSRLGQLSITDPNPGQSVTCAIISGNVGGIFGVDNSGLVYVANATALAASGTSSFTLGIQVTDNGTPSLSATGTVSLTLVSPASLPTQLRREIFAGITGGNLASLTNNPKYPNRPDSLETLTDFNSAQNIADNYGCRIRGLVVPPATGSYQFWIAADNGAVLNLSTDATAANLAPIASIPDNQYSSVGQWTAFASQTSASFNLVAGQKYFIEAIQKEDNGGDFVQVAWSGPGLPAGTNIIASTNLQPVDLNFAPVLGSLTVSMPQNIANGGVITALTAADSPLDTLSYQIISGNTGSTLAIKPGTSTLIVADNTLIANGSVTTFTLTVAVQDSGYGGLYPLRAGTNTVTVNVLPTGTVAPGLTHRYSFTANANDSIGTAHGVVNGGTVISGGKATFDGTSGFITLPGGMVSGYTDASFELWMNIQNNGNWPEAFAFGQQGGTGTGYIALIPRSGAGDYRQSYNPGTEYIITGGAGRTLDTSVPVYVACIYNQTQNQMSLYTNGVLVASLVPGTTLNLANVRTNFAYLGKSLFNDPYLKGSIDEFRVWNTPLSALQVKLNYLAGSNLVVSASLPAAVRLTTAPATLNVGEVRSLSLTADFATVSNVVVTPYATQWTSGNPFVLQVTTNGVVTAIAPGTAVISTTFAGVTSSVSLNVTLASPVITGQPRSQTRAVSDAAVFTVSASGGGLAYQWLKNGASLPGATSSTLKLNSVTFADDADYSVIVSNTAGTATSAVAQLSIVGPGLLHRWSFNDGTDSIRGANAVLMGSASYSGGKLLVPGGAARVNGASVNLADTLSRYPSVTIETWFTMNALQNWSKVWMFGNANGGNENGLSYLEFTPRAGADGNVPSLSFNSTSGTESNSRAGTNPGLLTTGVEYHVVAVYDSAANQTRLYLNGVLADTGSMGGSDVTRLAANEAYFGAAVNFSDPNLSGAINELRIWNAPLTAANVATNYLAGPNNLVSYLPPVTFAQTPGPGLTLTWTYGILESADALAGPWTTVPGATSPYTPAKDSPQQFYRIRAN